MIRIDQNDQIYKTPDEKYKAVLDLVKDKYEKEGHPYYASARLWDDGVIHPIDTRKILIQALQAIHVKPHEGTKFPVFRM